MKVPAKIYAFPFQFDDPNDESRHVCPGMTLRDYFAAKAMQAAATNETGANGFTFQQRADWAYRQADAMLKAREL
jgi:hypothetical protein